MKHSMYPYYVLPSVELKKTTLNIFTYLSIFTDRLAAIRSFDDMSVVSTTMNKASVSTAYFSLTVDDVVFRLPAEGDRDSL